MRRCHLSQDGRVPMNPAIVPAASTIAALTITLTVIWTVPSVNPCAIGLPCDVSLFVKEERFFGTIRPLADRRDDGRHFVGGEELCARVDAGRFTGARGWHPHERVRSQSFTRMPDRLQRPS